MTRKTANSPPPPTSTSLVYFTNPKLLLKPPSLSLLLPNQTDTDNKKMTSIIQTIKNRTATLPLSHADPSEKGLLRRRLSLNIQPISSPSNSWSAFRRSKSLTDAGSSIRKWWEWSLNWVMSRKPIFTRDLEMNGDETSARGGVKHLFYKIRSEVKKLVGSNKNVGLPQTYRYDSINYAKNFDDGRRSC